MFDVDGVPVRLEKQRSLVFRHSSSVSEPSDLLWLLVLLHLYYNLLPPPLLIHTLSPLGELTENHEGTGYTDTYSFMSFGPDFSCFRYLLDVRFTHSCLCTFRFSPDIVCAFVRWMLREVLPWTSFLTSDHFWSIPTEVLNRIIIENSTPVNGGPVGGRLLTRTLLHF